MNLWAYFTEAGKHKIKKKCDSFETKMLMVLRILLKVCKFLQHLLKPLAGLKFRNIEHPKLEGT